MNAVRWIRKEWGLRRANQSARKGNPSKALETIEKLMQDNNADIELIIQKTWILAELECFDEALTEVDRGIAIDTNHGVLHLIRGEVLYHLHRYEAAKAALLKSLELTGENIRAEYSLGLVYIALGDMERATRYFESSIRYDKNLVNSRLLTMAEHYLHKNQTS